jgi:nicotinamide riboside kinase
MVTKMYAEYYAKDETCALTQEEFERIAVMADEITRKSRWDKIFLLAPHGVFVDDHERYMAHSGMRERQEIFEILCKNIKESGNWNKVTILTGNYYENFMTIVRYVKDRIEKGMAD